MNGTTYNKLISFFIDKPGIEMVRNQSTRVMHTMFFLKCHRSISKSNGILNYTTYTYIYMYIPNTCLQQSITCDMIESKIVIDIILHDAAHSAETSFYYYYSYYNSGNQPYVINM